MRYLVIDTADAPQAFVLESESDDTLAASWDTAWRDGTPPNTHTLAPVIGEWTDDTWDALVVEASAILGVDHSTLTRVAPGQDEASDYFDAWRIDEGGE